MSIKIKISCQLHKPGAIDAYIGTVCLILMDLRTVKLRILAKNEQLLGILVDSVRQFKDFPVPHI